MFLKTYYQPYLFDEPVLQHFWRIFAMFFAQFLQKSVKTCFSTFYYIITHKESIQTWLVQTSQTFSTIFAKKYSVYLALLILIQHK